MALLFREGLLSIKWLPKLETVRFRRVNVQRPRAPHYERAKYMALMKPIYKQPDDIYLPPAVKCKKVEESQYYKTRIDNPLEKIMARELFEKFESSKMVCIVHENPIAIDDKFQANLLLRREKMVFEKHSKYTVERAFKDTRYEAILPLFVTHNAIIFSEETNVDALFKILKKVPQYVLMAGIIDNKLLSVTQLKKYSELKDITTARAQLVGVLNACGQRTVSQLTGGSQRLLYQLQHLASNQADKS